MGILRTLFLGDIGNHLDIQDNKREIARMRSRERQLQRSVDRNQDERIEALEKSIDHLQLLLTSLLGRLVSCKILSQQDVESLVISIEEEEGGSDR